MKAEPLNMTCVYNIIFCIASLRKNFGLNVIFPIETFWRDNHSELTSYLLDEVKLKVYAI